VVDAMDLYMEGKVGELNTYVCLQLRTQHGGSPYVAFTSCVLKSPAPEWHEVFRFDVETLDPTSCLVAWVIAAPGDEREDVIAGTELGLSEEQLRQAKQEQMMTGVPLARSQPEFSTAMQTAFNRLTRRADRNEDREVARLRKLAMAQARGCEPTMDLVMAQTKDTSPLEERRWNEVQNLRALLERSGCDIADPLVPRTHLPLGCVVVRFRQLREAVWGVEPVEISRTLRLNCRGNLRIEIDFRPQFFEVAKDPRLQLLSAQEEEEIYGVKPIDPEDDSLDLLSKLNQAPVAQPVDPFKKQLMDQARSSKAKKDPEMMYKRFKEVMNWSREMIEKGEEEHLLRKTLKSKERAARVKKNTERNSSTEGPSSALQEHAKVLAEHGRLAAVDAMQRYAESKKIRQDKQAAMDRPVGAPPPPPPVPRTAKAAIAQALKEATKPKQDKALLEIPDLKWPKLKTEPWLEEALESSKFV